MQIRAFLMGQKGFYTIPTLLLMSYFVMQLVAPCTSPFCGRASAPLSVANDAPDHTFASKLKQREL